MPGSIKFIGGVALMVSGLTGPSIAVIPQLFQVAGWLTPLSAFMLVAVLSGSAALLLVEAMTSIVGNEKFQAAVEYSTLAQLFLGQRWHWIFQIMLYIALQSQTITSLIESFQSMDTLLVTVAHKSCAISFQKGWECVSTIPDDGLGVFSDYIFISFGYLITLVLVLPMGLIQLSGSIKFQILSFLTLVFITIVWIMTFFQVGITNFPIPAIGTSQASVVGYVISNFAFVTTVPAFVNNVHPSTNIHRVIWLSLIISCVIYIIIGLAGAGAFNTPANSTILAVISARRPSLVALISVYLFPLAVLITSIPVFMIVVRYNLLRGNICSKPWAIFWSSIVPWIIVIPFQTKGWLTIIMNWTSLLFSSGANLIIPFILYLLSKRYRASAVLDHEQDEFQLRPLEMSSISIHNQPASRSQSIAEQPSTYPTKSIDMLSDVDDASAAKWPDNIIRLIKSPSIHRYYGEPVAEGTNAPRRPSSSKVTSASSVAEDEKTGLMSPPSFVMPDRHNSFSVASWRGANDASSMHSPTRAKHPLAPHNAPPLSTMHRPSGESAFSVHTDAARGSLRAPLAYASVPAASTGSHADRGALPITTIKATVPSGDVASFHISDITEDHDAPPRTFEAFPALRTHGFNSAKVAIVFCMLTTLMVFANVAYNIVLVIHGNYQG